MVFNFKTSDFVMRVPIKIPAIICVNILKLTGKTAKSVTTLNKETAHNAQASVLLATST